MTIFEEILSFNGLSKYIQHNDQLVFMGDILAIVQIAVAYSQTWRDTKQHVIPTQTSIRESNTFLCTPTVGDRVLCNVTSTMMLTHVH